MTFAQQLVTLNACNEAREWVGTRDLATAWRECERADWLAWLAARTVDQKTFVAALCDCADLAAAKVKPGPLLDAIRKCIDTTRAWTRDEATIENVRVARIQLWDLWRADDAAAAAAAAAAARVVGHPAVCAALRARITHDMVAAGLAARWVVSAAKREAAFQLALAVQRAEDADLAGHHRAAADVLDALAVLGPELLDRLSCADMMTTWDANGNDIETRLTDAQKTALLKLAAAARRQS